MTGEAAGGKVPSGPCAGMLWGKGPSKAELRHCQHGVRRSEQLQGLAGPGGAVSGPSGVWRAEKRALGGSFPQR